jgi:UDP-GlcNAc:undecaprenyl-phosphate GlcNAc-1-phosphate transferase
MWGDIAIAFLLAFITAYVVTPYTIRLARKVGALDVPKESRKIHTKPMPRLGGLAIIAGFMVSIIYLLIMMSIEKTINLKDYNNYYIKLIGLFGGAIVLAIFCIFDDIKGINPFVKLLGQTLAALIVTFAGIRIDKIIFSSFLNTLITEEIVSITITVIWIVGITNAINLIDGLDGLSSGISLISCISLLMIFALNDSPIISIILVTALGGAILGFLPFNFSPAKTFLGDTGSNFLGYTLSIIAILGVAKTYTAIVLIAPLIVFALPLLDTGLAIFRRLIKTKSVKGIFKADKEHLHHKIMRKGYSQKQAVLILYAFSATFGMFAIILLESGFWKSVSFALMVIAIGAIGAKDFFKIDESNIEYKNPKR